MQSLNWTSFLIIVVPAFIGLIFGVIGGYVTHRFQRIRDDIQWEREKLKLEQQWQQEREKINMLWQQKLQELELQYMKQERSEFRAELMKGVNDPQYLIRLIQVERILQDSLIQAVHQLAASIDSPTELRRVVIDVLAITEKIAKYNAMFVATDGPKSLKPAE